MQKLLHVGCGPKRKNKTTQGFNTPEWTEIRFDIDRSVNPDIIGSMTDMGMLPDAAVDAVFSSHNIEHLYPHEVPTALAEFARVLKPTGIAVITCPDLQSVCALVAANKLTQPAYTSSMGPISPLDILYGHRDSLSNGNLYMAHRCGFTAESLKAVLLDSGFASTAIFARPRHFDLWAFASKARLSNGQFTEIAKTHGFSIRFA